MHVGVTRCKYRWKSTARFYVICPAVPWHTSPKLPGSNSQLSSMAFCWLAGAAAARVHNQMIPKSRALDPSEDAILELQRALPHIRGPEKKLWGVKLTRTSNVEEAARQRFLLRAFLTAEEGDPRQARRRLEQTIRWRRTSNLLSSPPDGYGILPTDLLLCPGSSAQPTIVLDVAKLPAEAFTDADALVKWWVAMHDAMYTRVLASGSPCYTFVVDCSGLQRHHFNAAARVCAAKLAPMLTDHYPDQFAGETLVINSPAWFRGAYVVLRPFLPRTFVKSLRLARIKDLGPTVELTPTDQRGGARGRGKAGADGAVKALGLMSQRWAEWGHRITGREYVL